MTRAIRAELEILRLSEALVDVADRPLDGDDRLAVGDDLDMAGAARSRLCVYDEVDPARDGLGRLLP